MARTTPMCFNELPRRKIHGEDLTLLTSCNPKDHDCLHPFKGNTDELLLDFIYLLAIANRDFSLS